MTTSAPTEINAVLHRPVADVRDVPLGVSHVSEHCPLTSTHSSAAGVRDRILRRSCLPRADSGVRVTDVTFADGVRELVVSAPAATADIGSIRALARALAATGAAEDWVQRAATRHRPVPGSWLRPTASPVDAGQGTDGVVADVGGPVGGGTLIRAVAAVVARFAGGPSVSVATEDGPVMVEVDESRAVPDLVVRRLDSLDPSQGPMVGVDTGEPAPGGEWRGALMAPVELSADGERVICRFDVAEVDRAVAQAIVSAVTTMVRSPGDPLERVRLADWSHPSAVPGEQHETLCDAFAAQARTRPDAVAVTAGERQVNYATLAAKSDDLGRRLVAQGVHPHDLVGIAVADPVDAVTAMVGVLKAGAAYVPLDLEYPPDRLEFMTTDAGVSALVVGPPPTWGVDVPVVSVDVGCSVTTDEVRVPLPRPRRDDPAYVIYTSGSTGRPKGVVVRHRNVTALLAATGLFRFSCDDVWTQFHSTSFDFSVWEIWGCLASGGRLVAVSDESARDPEMFLDLVAREKVTVLNQTPSALARLLLADDSIPRAATVRTLVLGGESLDPRILDAWLTRYPDQSVVNMYGITETTVHCTFKTIDRRAVVSGSRSVGVALPGWSITVTDPDGRPLPPGVAGEMVVGGDGVAAGYLNRPQLSEERFGLVGSSGASAVAVYRSGDRGRILPSGEIEHLGRLDGQVKIRGYRVEPAEVQSLLQSDPAVTAAAVVVGGVGDDRYLAAYVVGSDAAPGALRRRLTDRLPQYMMPRSLTVVPALPTTLNGKLDVDRLSDLAAGDAADSDTESSQYRRPADAEGWLLALWRDTIGADIGPDDNLFAVGGTSLLAFRTVTEARRAGWDHISVRQVYACGSARALATTMVEGTS